MHGYMQNGIWICCFWLLLVVSCKNEDKQLPDEKRTDALYFDYSISAAEDREMVSCLFQFREAGANGDPVTLSDKVILRFDGKEVPADSARMAGTFYELLVPLSQFAGKHTILFRAPSGREYEETFTFQPFALQGPADQTISRNQFELQLSGVKNSEPLGVILTDTSFLSNDLNRLDTAKNGRLQIAPQNLAEVKNGPVILQLFKNEELKLKDAPRQGGRLLISYALQRELFLRN